MADHKLLDSPVCDAPAPRHGAYLERLEKLAASGGHGVDLGKMSTAEIRKRLLGR